MVLYHNGFTVIMDAIKKLENVEKINLYDNELGAGHGCKIDAAEYLCEVFADKDTLPCLKYEFNVGGNKFPDDDQAKLKEAWEKGNREGALEL